MGAVSKLLFCCLVFSSILLSDVQGMCELTREVKFLLETMTGATVKAVADCIVGAGPCDQAGNDLKKAAPSIVCTPGCGNRECSCDEINVRVVVRRIKSKYPAQMKRIKDKFEKGCASYSGSRSLSRGQLSSIVKGLGRK